MDNIILTTIPVNDLQAIIIDCVNTCLKRDRSEKNILNKIDTLNDPDEILNIKQASDFIKLATPTIYKLVGEKNIPHIKKGGKLLFLKKELLKWANEGRQKTRKEIHADAETWLGKLGEKKGC